MPIMAKTRKTPAPVATPEVATPEVATPEVATPEVATPDVLATVAAVLAAPASVQLVDRRAAAVATVASKHTALATAAQAAYVAGVPRHILAAFASKTGGSVPAALAGKLVVTGRTYRAQKPHEIAWAAAMQACVDAAGPAGATVEACVAAVQACPVAGSGLHSVKAYIGRGWFALK